MPKFRVTVRTSSIDIVEAENPYQAAVVASARAGVGAEIADVRPAAGRAPSNGSRTAPSKSTKKVAKKRRPLSPEARARLAQNLVKARAARAAKRKGVKKTTKKSSAKKPTRKGVKKTSSAKKATRKIARKR